MANAEPPVFTRPISATLAMALGQAAAGFVSAAAMYFVANYDPADNGMYGIQGPFAGWGALPDPVKALVENESMGWFGPFTNAPLYAPDPGQDTVCEMRITAQSPEGTLLPPFTLYPVRMHTESPPETDTPPFDAVFMSAQAIRKFVVPYYSAIYGPEFAVTLLKGYEDADLALMLHLPWSEYEGILPPGEPGHGVRSDVERFTVYVRNGEDGNEGYTEKHYDTPPRHLR